MHVCMCYRMVNRMYACLLACMPRRFNLQSYIPAYLPTHLPTSTYLPTHPPTYPPPPTHYLPTYLPACLPPCLPTYLPDRILYVPYIPSYIPTYLRTCLHTHTYFPSCRHIYRYAKYIHTYRRTDLFRCIGRASTCIPSASVNKPIWTAAALWGAVQPWLPSGSPEHSIWPTKISEIRPPGHLLVDTGPQILGKLGVQARAGV